MRTTIRIVIATEVDHPERYAVLGEYLYTDESVVFYMDTYSAIKQVSQDCVVCADLETEV